MYKRIKELRQDHDLTQAQIAKILSVSRSAYAHYENGERAIPLDILVKIADEFETSIDYMLNRIDYDGVPITPEDAKKEK